MKSDEGSAVVEFVLVVGVLLLPLFAGILQLGLVLHSRNVVVASATAGARYGASANSTAAAGAVDACARIQAALAGVRRGLSCTGSYVSSGGDEPVELVEVHVTGPLPMFFLPVGSLSVDVRGHSVRETAP